MEKKKKRVEVVLTDADIDIIEFIESKSMQNATLFKVAMRAYMKQQDEERFDVRVKRLLNEVLSEGNFKQATTVDKVANKNRLKGFGAKKVKTEE